MVLSRSCILKMQVSYMKNCLSTFTLFLWILTENRTKQKAILNLNQSGIQVIKYENWIWLFIHTCIKRLFEMESKQKLNGTRIMLIWTFCSKSNKYGKKNFNPSWNHWPHCKTNCVGVQRIEIVNSNLRRRKYSFTYSSSSLTFVT